MRIISDSPEQTIEVGRKLGGLLKAGDVVALMGELGAGKTCLIKGLAAGLGAAEPQEVTSPSFIILKEYRGTFPLYHIDLFRLDRPEEVTALDLEEFIYGDGVCAIEWADKFPQILPPARLEVLLKVEGDTTRTIELVGHGAGFGELVRLMER